MRVSNKVLAGAVKFSDSLIQLSITSANQIATLYFSCSYWKGT